MTDDRVQTGLRLPAQLHARCIDQAEAAGVSINEWINRAVQAVFDAHDQRHEHGRPSRDALTKIIAVIEPYAGEDARLDTIHAIATTALTHQRQDEGDEQP